MKRLITILTVLMWIFGTVPFIGGLILLITQYDLSKDQGVIAIMAGGTSLTLGILCALLVILIEQDQILKNEK